MSKIFFLVFKAIEVILGDDIGRSILHVDNIFICARYNYENTLRFTTLTSKQFVKHPVLSKNTRK